MADDTFDTDESELFPIERVDPLGTYLRELWRRRDYIIHVPLNELRVQNANTLLGNVWLVMNPLLQVGVYFIVFGLLLKTDRGVDNFLPFLTTGVMTFSYSQRVILSGAKSIPSSIGLIRTLRFPRAVLPLSSSIAQTLAFGPVFAVMITVMLASGVYPTWRWLFLLPVFVLQALFSLGGSFLVARMNHHYGDVENSLPFLFRLTFYMSGVLYSVEAFVSSKSVLALFALNPMYCIVSAWRWAVMGIHIEPEVVLSLVIWSFGLLVVGFLVFRSAEADYGS